MNKTEEINKLANIFNAMAELGDMTWKQHYLMPNGMHLTIKAAEDADNYFHIRLSSLEEEQGILFEETGFSTRYSYEKLLYTASYIVNFIDSYEFSVEELKQITEEEVLINDYDYNNKAGKINTNYKELIEEAEAIPEQWIYHFKKQMRKRNDIHEAAVNALDDLADIYFVVNRPLYKDISKLASFLQTVANSYDKESTWKYRLPNYMWLTLHHDFDAWHATFSSDVDMFCEPVGVIFIESDVVDNLNAGSDYETSALLAKQYILAAKKYIFTLEDIMQLTKQYFDSPMSAYRVKDLIDEDSMKSGLMPLTYEYVWSWAADHPCEWVETYNRNVRLTGEGFKVQETLEGLYHYLNTCAKFYGLKNDAEKAVFENSMDCLYYGEGFKRLQYGDMPEARAKEIWGYAVDYLGNWQ